MATVTNGRNQLSTVGGVAAAYDSKGNLTADPMTAKTFTYSSENLVKSASGGVTLSYDPLMRLQTLTGPATTQFAYDGLDMIGEYDGGNVLQRRYVFGPGTDEPVVQYEGADLSTRRWLHADERGSIVAISDDAGNKLTINSYDEYGRPAAANSGRFEYTGQMWLPELGAYDYKARMYEPALGRFLQTDPVGYADGPNFYTYVGNDPVNLRDPLGLEGVIPQFAYCGWGCAFIDGNVVITGPSNPDGGLALGRSGSSGGTVSLSAGSAGAYLGGRPDAPAARPSKGDNSTSRAASTNRGRSCTGFQKGAESVSDFFESASSGATDLAVGTGGSGVLAAALGAESVAGTLEAASLNFAAQAAVFGVLAKGASLLSGNTNHAVSGTLTSLLLKKIYRLFQEGFETKCRTLSLGRVTDAGNKELSSSLRCAFCFARSIECDDARRGI